MITEGKNDLQRGEYIESAILLVDDLSWHLNQYHFIYTNQQQVPVLRFKMQGNQLVYQYFSFEEQLWKDGGSITPSGPQQRIPQTGGSFILFEPGLIKQYIDDSLQSTLSAGNFDLGGKTITGLLASADVHSAVTLEQVQGIVAGETSDTIVSSDLHSRVKTFSSYIYIRANDLDALSIYKPSVSTLQLNTETADSVSIVSSAATNALILQTQTDALALKLQNGSGFISKPLKYDFDSQVHTLTNDDLVDLKSVTRDFVSKTADSDLNMNGHQIRNLQNATFSSDAVPLGQLTTHQYLYTFSSQDQTPVAAIDYITFDQTINPVPLVPSVASRTTKVDSTRISILPGTYRIAINVLLRYKVSTQNPATVYLEGSSGNVLQSALFCRNTDDFGRVVSNERTFVLRVSTADQFRVKIQCDPSSTDQIVAGSSLDIQTIQ